MPHLNMNPEGLRRYLQPNSEGRTVMAIPLGDEEYRITFRRCSKPATHTDPPVPGGPCTPGEVVDLTSRIFIACAAAAR